MEQLETISVFQQRQVNITFFANHSAVLLIFPAAALATVCYWPMIYSVETYIMTRNGNSYFFPLFFFFFATLLFLFVDRPLELLATVLFAFIRLSANLYEKSRSAFSFSCGIFSCTLCFLYKIEIFIFAMSTKFQKTLIYHFLVFIDIWCNAISISATPTCPNILL